MYDDFASVLIAAANEISSVTVGLSAVRMGAMAGKSCLLEYARTTLMRFLVNVPVLSEQIVVALPMVSHEASTLHSTAQVRV